jgi:transcriptional regulator with XRE-family HTH domain
MNISGISVVERIGKEVDKKGLKRAELYKIVPSGTLSNWKNQGQGPNSYTLYKVAVFLGVSVDYLLTGKEPPGLSSEETELVKSFRALDTQKDKDEIMGLINLKIENSKKGDAFSNSSEANA